MPPALCGQCGSHWSQWRPQSRAPECEEAEALGGPCARALVGAVLGPQLWTGSERAASAGPCGLRRPPPASASSAALDSAFASVEAVRLHFPPAVHDTSTRHIYRDGPKGPARRPELRPMVTLFPPRGWVTGGLGAALSRLCLVRGWRPPRAYGDQGAPLCLCRPWKAFRSSSSQTWSD